MDAPANTISGGVKNDIYRDRLFCYRNSSAVLGVFIMKIGDRCFVHGYVDEIRKDVVIIKNKGGYFGTDPGEVITVTDTAHPNWIPLSEKFPQKDEDVLLQFPSNQGVGYYEDGDWMINTGDGIYSIIGYNEEKPIAWMPLPEPYKEE